MGCCLRLSAFDVFGLQTLFARNNIEVDVIAFVQGSEAIALDRAVMDEDVLTGFLGDEAKPVFVIKPLYFATGHNALSPETDARGDRHKKRTQRYIRCVLLHLEPHTPQLSFDHKVR
jgi:hypothetical protein